MIFYVENDVRNEIFKRECRGGMKSDLHVFQVTNLRMRSNLKGRFDACNKFQYLNPVLLCTFLKFGYNYLIR